MKIGFIGLGNVGGKLAGSLQRNKFNSSYSIQELCVDQGICSSFSETKRLISQGALYINESKVEDSKEELNTSHTINGELLIVKRWVAITFVGILQFNTRI